MIRSELAEKDYLEQLQISRKVLQAVGSLPSLDDLYVIHKQASVAQLADALDSNSSCCGFDSHLRYESGVYYGNQNTTQDS